MEQIISSERMDTRGKCGAGSVEWFDIMRHLSPTIKCTILTTVPSALVVHWHELESSVNAAREQETSNSEQQMLTTTFVICIQESNCQKHSSGKMSEQ